MFFTYIHNRINILFIIKSNCINVAKKQKKTKYIKKKTRPPR